MNRIFAAALLLMPLLCNAQNSETARDQSDLIEDLESQMIDHTKAEYIGRTALITGQWPDYGSYALSENLENKIKTPYINRPYVILDFIPQETVRDQMQKKMYSSIKVEMKYKTSGIYYLLDQNGFYSGQYFVKLRDVETGEVIYYYSPSRLVLIDHIADMQNHYDGRHFALKSSAYFVEAVLVEKKERSISLGKKTFNVTEFATDKIGVSPDVEWECAYVILESKELNARLSNAYNKVYETTNTMVGFLLTNESGDRIFWPDGYGYKNFDTVFEDLDLRRERERQEQERKRLMEEQQQQKLKQQEEELKRLEEERRQKEMELQKNREEEEKLKEVQSRIEEEKKRLEEIESQIAREKEKEENKQAISAKLRQL